jgi:hypothetical protein
MRVWRIGYDIDAFLGATVPVVAFLGIELFLFHPTRPLQSAEHA